MNADRRHPPSGSESTAIDPIDWPAGVCLTAFGVPFGIRVNDETILSRLLDCLPPGWTRSSSRFTQRWYSFTKFAGAGNPARDMMQLCANAGKLTQTSDFEYLLHIFESDLQLYI